MKLLVMYSRTWIRDLMTSAGNTAIQRDTPAIPPQKISRKGPVKQKYMYTFKDFVLMCWYYKVVTFTFYNKSNVSMYSINWVLKYLPENLKCRVFISISHNFNR